MSLRKMAELLNHPLVRLKRLSKIGWYWEIFLVNLGIVATVNVFPVNLSRES